jgi:hypothetical protein
METNKLFKGCGKEFRIADSFFICGKIDYFKTGKLKRMCNECAKKFNTTHSWIIDKELKKQMLVETK